MSTTATPAATDPLALPDDQFWLGELIEAAIAYEIADAECMATVRKRGKRYAVACLFRQATLAASREAWSQFCLIRDTRHLGRPQQVAA